MKRRRCRRRCRRRPPRGRSRCCRRRPSPSGNAAATPVDDFAKEYRQFKESLTGLPKKIEDTTRSVEGHVNGAVAHQQLSALRAIVAEALKQVADNGSVAKIGQTALNFS